MVCGGLQLEKSGYQSMIFRGPCSMAHEMLILRILRGTFHPYKGCLKKHLHFDRSDLYMPCVLITVLLYTVSIIGKDA